MDAACGDAALLNYHIVGVTRDGIPDPGILTGISG